MRSEITVNHTKLQHWLTGLAAWVVFVLALAALRRDLSPTWAEVAWLIGPAVVYVVVCLFGSLLLTYAKLLLTGGADAGRTIDPYRTLSPEAQVRAGRDCAQLGARSGARLPAP